MAHNARADVIFDRRVGGVEERERERLKGEIAWVERPDIGDRETETG